jgi:hypothetical protein
MDISLDGVFTDHGLIAFTGYKHGRSRKPDGD